MQTLCDLITQHGVDVHDHLDRDELVPVHTALQFQGDLAIIPTATLSKTAAAGAEVVPADGIPVVRGENGGNTHLLLPGAGVKWWQTDARSGASNPLDLGIVTVPEGAAAYLAHPEHGYLGIGPGAYTIRRQREQADEIRMVAD